MRGRLHWRKGVNLYVRRESMLQFSLRSLLVAVAAVAIGTTAFLKANAWWASGLFAAEILLLLFAGAEVIFRRGQSAFWMGYLVTGSLYVLILMASFTNELASPFHFRTLPTTQAIMWGYSWLPDSARVSHLQTSQGGSGMTGGSFPVYGNFIPGATGSGPGGSMPGTWFTPGMPGTVVMANPSYVDQNLFIQIGHAIFAICLAWLGGTVADWRYGKRAYRTPAHGP
jgi:hypothetical protein